MNILVKISWPQNIIKYRSVGKGLAGRRWDDSVGERGERVGLRGTKIYYIQV